MSGLFASTIYSSRYPMGRNSVDDDIVVISDDTDLDELYDTAEETIGKEAGSSTNPYTVDWTPRGHANNASSSQKSGPSSQTRNERKRSSSSSPSPHPPSSSIPRSSPPSRRTDPFSFTHPRALTSSQTSSSSKNNNPSSSCRTRTTGSDPRDELFVTPTLNTSLQVAKLVDVTTEQSKRQNHIEKRMAILESFPDSVKEMIESMIAPLVDSQGRNNKDQLDRIPNEMRGLKELVKTVKDDLVAREQREKKMKNEEQVKIQVLEKKVREMQNERENEGKIREKEKVELGEIKAEYAKMKNEYQKMAETMREMAKTLEEVRRQSDAVKMMSSAQPNRLPTPPPSAVSFAEGIESQDPSRDQVKGPEQSASGIHDDDPSMFPAADQDHAEVTDNHIPISGHRVILYEPADGKNTNNGQAVEVSDETDPPQVIDMDDFVNDTGEYTDPFMKTTTVNPSDLRLVKPAEILGPKESEHGDIVIDLLDNYQFGSDAAQEADAEVFKARTEVMTSKKTSESADVEMSTGETSDSSQDREQLKTPLSTQRNLKLVEGKRRADSESSASAGPTPRRSLRPKRPTSYAIAAPISPRSSASPSIEPREATPVPHKQFADWIPRRKPGRPLKQQTKTTVRQRRSLGSKPKIGIRTLGRGDGTRRGNGEWPPKLEYTVLGRAQEIVCDICKGRVHWFCAGLEDDQPAPEGEWHCPDCIAKLKEGQLRGTIESAPQLSCIRWNCLMRAKVRTIRRDGDEEHYYPESVIGRRAISRNEDLTRNFEYLVKWVDWPIETSTWEPLDHIKKQEYMITEFMNRMEELSLPTGPKVNLLPEAKKYFDAFTGDALNESDDEDSVPEKKVEKEDTEIANNADNQKKDGSPGVKGATEGVLSATAVTSERLI